MRGQPDHHLFALAEGDRVEVRETPSDLSAVEGGKGAAADDVAAVPGAPQLLGQSDELPPAARKDHREARNGGVEAEDMFDRRRYFTLGVERNDLALMT